MFVTEATAPLAHALPAVAAVLGRVAALPHWCAGVRRARLPAGGLPRCGPEGCALLYLTPDVRLVLVVRTVERVFPAGPIVHEAVGDGVSIVWTFTLEAEPSPTGAATRLHARIALEVDPAHPLAAYRAMLCRLIARRAPEDLGRLDALLDRRAARTAALPTLAGVPAPAALPAAREPRPLPLG
jgi:hypothetical protein